MNQLNGIEHVFNGASITTTQRSLIARVAQAVVDCAVLIVAQVWLLAGAALTVTAVVVLTANHGLDRAPFAIPAAVVKAPWSVEVSSFAGRVHRAFGIRRSVATEFSGWILEASERQGLSPELLASVVYAESTFRKDVVSENGAVGPAQVKTYWSGFCGSADLTDPAENIYCGAQILAHFRDVCGSEQCALSAYNVGMKNERSDEFFQQRGRIYARKIDRHVGRLDRTVL